MKCHSCPQGAAKRRDRGESNRGRDTGAERGWIRDAACEHEGEGRVQRLVEKTALGVLHFDPLNRGPGSRSTF